MVIWCLLVVEWKKNGVDYAGCHSVDTTLVANSAKQRQPCCLGTLDLFRLYIYSNRIAKSTNAGGNKLLIKTFLFVERFFRARSHRPFKLASIFDLNAFNHWEGARSRGECQTIKQDFVI